MRQEVIQKAPEQAKKTTPNMTGIPEQSFHLRRYPSHSSPVPVYLHSNSNLPKLAAADAALQDNHIYLRSGANRDNLLLHELAHMELGHNRNAPSTHTVDGLAICYRKDWESQADRLSSSIDVAYYRFVDVAGDDIVSSSPILFGKAHEQMLSRYRNESQTKALQRKDFTDYQRFLYWIRHAMAELPVTNPHVLRAGAFGTEHLHNSVFGVFNDSITDRLVKHIFSQLAPVRFFMPYLLEGLPEQMYIQFLGVRIAQGASDLNSIIVSTLVDGLHNEDSECTQFVCKIFEHFRDHKKFDMVAPMSDFVIVDDESDFSGQAYSTVLHSFKNGFINSQYFTNFCAEFPQLLYSLLQFGISNLLNDSQQDLLNYLGHENLIKVLQEYFDKQIEDFCSSFLREAVARCNSTVKNQIIRDYVDTFNDPGFAAIVRNSIIMPSSGALDVIRYHVLQCIQRMYLDMPNLKTMSQILQSLNFENIKRYLNFELLKSVCADNPLTIANKVFEDIWSSFMFFIRRSGSTKRFSMSYLHPRHIIPYSDIKGIISVCFYKNPFDPKVGDYSQTEQYILNAFNSIRDLIKLFCVEEHPYNQKIKWIWDEVTRCYLASSRSGLKDKKVRDLVTSLIPLLANHPRNIFMGYGPGNIALANRFDYGKEAVAMYGNEYMNTLLMWWKGALKSLDIDTRKDAITNTYESDVSRYLKPMKGDPEGYGQF